MRVSACCLGVMISLTSLLRADDLAAESPDDLPTVSLASPKEWRQERIDLPPGFAPDMTVSGFEEIRFAPGMFDADSESFFSYVIIFVLAGEPLDKDALERELLVYYRGLAAAVGPGRGLTIDADTFTLELAELEEEGEADAEDADDDSAGADEATEWIGTLNWVEPFVTGDAQELRIEIRVGAIEDSDASYVTMCVSPQDTDAEIWQEMHEVQDSAKFTPAE